MFTTSMYCIVYTVLYHCSVRVHTVLHIVHKIYAKFCLNIVLLYYLYVLYAVGKYTVHCTVSYLH